MQHFTSLDSLEEEFNNTEDKDDLVNILQQTIRIGQKDLGLLPRKSPKNEKKVSVVEDDDEDMSAFEVPGIFFLIVFKNLDVDIKNLPKPTNPLIALQAIQPSKGV